LKRFIDLTVSSLGLLLGLPVLLPITFLVWIQDFKSPFYIPLRVGKNNKQFKMIKLRSMVVDADSSGVDSTSSNDNRITKIGHIIRKFKLDELTQLWNVFKGDMSLVGPRPNVISEINLYTDVEKKLLTVRPGITDLSSIIFSDEGDILANKNNPDLAYNQLIRPWKSRLGILYIENQSTLLDIQLIFLTIIAIFSRKTAIRWISKKLIDMNANENIVEISKREIELYSYPPPGSNKVVTSR
jgi:lipopolysaccharide/colanic/teichoic acid biosynthesis glycosyltransferase